MLKKEPPPERALLGFKDSVLASFKFLGEFGLHPVEEKSTLVRYESANVFVNVYHGRASFEIGVEIGKLNQPETKLSIFDIVRWAGAEKAESLGQHVMFQVSSREGVQEFVPKVAGLVRKYAIPFLHPEEDAYRTALESRAERYADEMKQAKLEAVRSKAEAAWHARDYATVVQLYGTIRQQLSDAEATKLAYADRQLLGTASGAPSRKSR
jgi:hypothetical protein